jgi:hypothetical protein
MRSGASQWSLEAQKQRQFQRRDPHNLRGIRHKRMSHFRRCSSGEEWPVDENDAGAGARVDLFYPQRLQALPAVSPLVGSMNGSCISVLSKGGERRSNE